MTAEGEQVGGSGLAPVIERLDQLADLFKRRLGDDRHKQQMFDALYEQLQFSRQIAQAALIAPILRRLWLLIDRLDALPSDPTVLSIVDELVDVLAEQGIAQIGSPDDRFDPEYQEISHVVVGDATDDIRVRQVLRRGWRTEDRVVRPMLVTVSEQKQSG